MMIINCSAAAAVHLYGKYKKSADEGFFEPSCTVDESVMQRQDRLRSQGVMQWVVHAVKVGRSTCLIAMEVDTRWTHVIHQVRKGDVQGFIERLNTRLINGIEWLGADFSLFTTQQMEESVERYFAKHRELRFYQQSDTSVMGHISQVSTEYQYVYHRVGAFPEDEQTALEFDLQLNNNWRCRKGEKYDLKANEKMLLTWLQNYMGQSAGEAQKNISTACKAQQALMRKELHMMQDIQFRTQELSETGNNVTDLAEFRGKRKTRQTSH